MNSTPPAGLSEATVMATGARTALGRIGGSMAGLAPRSSRLHDELTRLVRALAVGGVAFVAVVLVQQLGHWAAWSGDALRLAGLATIVVGNIAMLQWWALWRLAASR
jgi:Ca2+-transporting ATPase